MKRFLMFSALTLLSAAPAAAQEFPRWDLSGDVGWLSSNKSDISAWDDWYDEPSGGLSVGRYWSSHLKTELRVALSGEGRTYEEQRVAVPWQTFPTFRLREHLFRKTTFDAGAHYQFFDNQWFHPQVGAGLAIERETERQFTPPDREVTATGRWGARPFVTGGFKWYANERGFVRSDLRVYFGRDHVSHFTWTAGIGVDL
jgi:hypothetical protein